MDENSTKADRRVDAGISPDQYHSVQFTKRDLCIIYQFKIWNIAKKGMCILVRHDSNMMNHLKVGDLLDMEYYSEKVFDMIFVTGSFIRLKREVRQFSGTSVRILTKAAI